MPHSSRWTCRRRHLVHGKPLSIVTPSVLNNCKIRGINWPAGFDICAFPMSCRKWRLVWSINFAGPAKLWRHHDLIYARQWTISSSTTFHFSKWNVTIVSGDQAQRAHTQTQRQQRAMNVWVFFLQIFCEWCGCHFIKRGYESPHMMCLENSNREFNMSYSKTSWCYPLKPLIKIKSSSQHFQWILRVVLSLTGGGAKLNSLRPSDAYMRQ